MSARGRRRRGEARETEASGGVPVAAPGGVPDEALVEVIDEAVIHRERMRALGELASGIMHDLNNTMQALRLRLEMMRGDPECPPQQRQHLDFMIRLVADSGVVLGRMQEFSRPGGVPADVPVDVATLLEEAVAMVAAGAGGVRIEAALATVPRVRADRAELRHVFLNLLLNARDAMPGGGTIRVAAAPEPPGVAVTITDEGPGVPAGDRERIFEPFFTTKKHGTGLGLWLARAVMTRLGGRITVENVEPRGARFRLELPTAGGADGESP